MKIEKNGVCIFHFFKNNCRGFVTRSSVQNLTPRNLRGFEFFLNYGRNCLKSNLVFRNLKIYLIVSINYINIIFKYLQLISIKNRIFGGPLNIFMLNNNLKIECSQIFTFLGFKMI